MGDVFIVSAARTPIGNFGGSLKKTPVAQLVALVLKSALKKAGLQPVAGDRQKQLTPRHPQRPRPGGYRKGRFRL